MPENVTIPLNEKDYLDAVYCAPAEVTDKTRDETLVIMAHGYPEGSKSGQKNLFGRFENSLSKDGYHTFRFDFFGCGGSAGDPSAFSLATAQRDFDTVLNWAISGQKFRRLVYIAEGLGAAIAVRAVSPTLAAMVLLWPVLDLPVLAASAPAGVAENATLMEELRGGDLTPALRAVSAPTMIQQGALDEIVLPAHLDLARVHLRPKRRLDITVHEDGGHGLTSPAQRETLLRLTRQFLDKYA